MTEASNHGNHTDGVSTTEYNGNGHSAEEDDSRVNFAIVFLVVATLGVIWATVFFLIRKRRLDILRHRLMPFYTFDKADNESDWETDVLNNVENPNYTAAHEPGKRGDSVLLSMQEYSKAKE